MRKLDTLLLLVCSTLLLAACGSTVKLDDTTAGGDHGKPEPVRPCCANPQRPDPLDDSQRPLVKRSIYFDFEGYTVKEEYKPVIEAHSKYLREHKSRHAIIAGNADERGGHEYNLALGQLRAEAVRRALVAYGVPDAQMDAISYGAEKPKATGHDEAAWAENRRVDLEY